MSNSDVIKWDLIPLRYQEEARRILRDMYAYKGETVPELIAKGGFTNPDIPVYVLWHDLGNLKKDGVRKIVQTTNYGQPNCRILEKWWDEYEKCKGIIEKSKWFKL